VGSLLPTSPKIETIPIPASQQEKKKTGNSEVGSNLYAESKTFTSEQHNPSLS
jgi:hypothetical protein